MRIIIIMLVFEPELITLPWNLWSFPTTLPRACPDAAWLHVYMIPVIFNHYSFAGFLRVPHPPAPLPRHQQVIVIMNSEIIGLIRVGFMLCFERHSPDTIAWQSDSLNLFNWKISPFWLHSSVHYPQKLFAAFPAFLFTFIYYYRWVSRTLNPLLSRPSVRIIGIYFSLVA